MGEKIGKEARSQITRDNVGMAKSLDFIQYTMRRFYAPIWSNC